MQSWWAEETSFTNIRNGDIPYITDSWFSFWFNPMHPNLNLNLLSALHNNSHNWKVKDIQIKVKHMQINGENATRQRPTEESLHLFSSFLKNDPFVSENFCSSHLHPLGFPEKERFISVHRQSLLLPFVGGCSKKAKGL